MKSIFFCVIPILVLATLPACNCNAQVKIINNSLVDTSGNILFVKFENEISIAGSQCNNCNLISKRKASITRQAATNFIVIPASTGADTLLLFEKNKLVYQKIFRVDSLPGFILALGTIKEGPATKEQIILNKRLQVYFPNCKCPTVYVVGSFRLEFISINIASHEKYMFIQGNTLTDDAINLIRKLSSMDQVIFKDIYLQDVSSRPIQIERFVLNVR